MRLSFPYPLLMEVGMLKVPAAYMRSRFFSFKKARKKEISVRQ